MKIIIGTKGFICICKGVKRIGAPIYSLQINIEVTNMTYCAPNLLLLFFFLCHKQSCSCHNFVLPHANIF